MGLKEFGKKLFPDSAIDSAEDYEDIYGADAGYDEDRSARTSDFGRTSSNVTVASGASIEMKVVTPNSFETVTQIADLLLSNKTVLLNLENTNKETSKRLIDFLSGVAYALEGDVQKVADNTYAITPNNVAVSKESMAQQTSVQESGSVDINF